MEPIYARQIDPDPEPRWECCYCGRGVEEGDGACEDCANEHDVCMVCGEALERMTRDDYTRFPTCPKHN